LRIFTENQIKKMSETHTLHEEEVLDDTKTQEPAKAILFNDEVHTFDEVISQIMKATGCDLPTAEIKTWEVHNTGKSCVFTGELSKCLQVTSVLEEIELMTQIEY
jgi:ATP-dependent Clp protease adaptor protein ClpS